MPARTRPDATIGDRLRRLRSERGLTQEQLAERAGVSVDLIKKLEQGRRESARLTSLTALATALDVPRSDLLDKRPRLDGDQGLMLRIRDAILSLDVLDAGEVTDEPPAPVATLWEHVGVGWRDHWAGRFTDLAKTLPALIAETRHAFDAGGADASGPLAQAYQLAANLLVHLGREDLAAVAAERGIVVAKAGDDELQWAALNGAYCWTLLGQARNSDAERLAMRTAERIEPRLSTATPEHLTVWGGMVLWGLAAAVEDAQRDRAVEYLSLARAGAERVEQDRHDYHLNYGRSQVAMQATYTHASLGEPDKALAAAADVRRSDLYRISYGRHLLDVAQAHVLTRAYDEATAVLQQARDVAPVWFRHQAPARVLVTDLAERRTRLTPALRDLVNSLEVHRAG
jgi:transcriptional regulator with XRE-family HTH domain